MMKPEYFINREISWLEFNFRVLEEAMDKNNPLLERIKFLAITASNLDEFFMVRVASLKDQVNAGFKKADAAGLTPSQQLKLIAQKASKMTEEMCGIYKKLTSSLKKENIIKISNSELKEPLADYFDNIVYPVLTPMAVDESRPFPLILNKSINIAVILKNRKNEEIFSTVQVPSVLPRLVEFENKYVLLEDLIKMNINKLYKGYEVKHSYTYRITRNADLSIEEEEAQDLLGKIKKSLQKRRWGAVIRLEVENKINSKLLNFLKKSFEVSEEFIFHIDGPLDLTFLFKLYNTSSECQLQKYEEYQPHTMEFDNIFEEISKKDLFLHHPYDSFDPVIEFIKQAAADENVLAIKQTLYRVSGNSPIVKALQEAAERGKQVMVLVEVQARFDEENNINWANSLEKSGCHVIYGFSGLKTHSKITMVVRREDDGIKRYIHLGTGNYNDATAKIYTDMCILTKNEYIAYDASGIFNMLSGYSDAPELYKMEIAPPGLRNKLTNLIKNEMNNALEGKKAVIVAKMNALSDTQIVEKLYEASNAGVKIFLIVRGICCLKPQVKGVSENISVISIVGRFLEHSRIMYFYNKGKENIYLSSADWMSRNLDKRVEVMFPVEEKEIKEKIKQILNITLSDNVKSRVLTSTGEYRKNGNEKTNALNSQEIFCEGNEFKKYDNLIL